MKRTKPDISQTKLAGHPIELNQGLRGAIGAAITVGVRRGGLLLSILVLPLYIPTLIFGARVVENALLDLATLPALALTAAITLLAAAIAPFAAAAALRINAR